MAILLLTLFAGLQLLPLPVSLLALLSPERAEIANSVARVADGSWLAALSLSPGSTWRYLLRVAAAAIMVVLLSRLTNADGRARWMLTGALIVIGGIAALIGLTDAGETRIAGPFFSPNHFAAVLALTLPFAIGAAFVRTADQTASRWMAVVGAAACGVLFLAILASLSRAAFFSLIGSLAAMAMAGLGRRAHSRPRVVAAVVIVAAIVAVLVVAPIPLVERFERLLPGDGYGRLAIWQDALRMVAAYPLFGVGLGSFYPAILGWHSAPTEFAWTTTHSDYLQLLSELGVVGFAIVTVLFGALLWTAVRSAYTAPEAGTRLFAAACTGSLVAVALHSAADSNLYGLPYLMAFAWVAGLTLSLSSSTSTPPTTSPARGLFVRKAVAALSVVVILAGSAHLAFGWGFMADASAERVFCRVGACDERPLRARLAAAQQNAAEWPTFEEIAHYVRRDPARPDLWVELANAARRGGDHETARRALEQAMELGPHAGYPMIEAASLAFETGDPGRALTLLRKALETSPSSERGVFALLHAHDVYTRPRSTAPLARQRRAAATSDGSCRLGTPTRRPGPGRVSPPPVRPTPSSRRDSRSTSARSSHPKRAGAPGANTRARSAMRRTLFRTRDSRRTRRARASTGWSPALEPSLSRSTPRPATRAAVRCGSTSTTRTTRPTWACGRWCGCSRGATACRRGYAPRASRLTRG